MKVPYPRLYEQQPFSLVFSKPKFYPPDKLQISVPEIPYQYVQIAEKIDDVLQVMEKQIYPKFAPHEIPNADESGINYEIHRARTLLHIGEKGTEVVAVNKTATSHSYSVLPSISLEGKFFSSLFLCHQEHKGVFGPQVLQTTPKLQNVYVDSTKSGIIDKRKFLKFIEVVLVKNIKKKCCGQHIR